MTSQLQTLISSAEKLSPVEQVELIRAVSQFLYQSYLPQIPKTDFWQPLTIEEIVERQQTPPVQNISALRADFWPEEESADDFIAYIYQQRKEDNLSI